MNTLKERFDFLKKEHDITNQKLAELLNMSADAVRMAITRESIKTDQFQEIEQAFNISKEWMETGKGDLMVPPPKRVNIPKEMESDIIENKGMDKTILERAEQTGKIESGEVKILRGVLAYERKKAMLVDLFQVEYAKLEDQYDELKAKWEKLSMKAKNVSNHDDSGQRNPTH